jgi:ABC-type glycerol-3-phosphate transport system substrate-binding protein
MKRFISVVIIFALAATACFAKEKVVLKSVGRTFAKASLEWALTKLQENHPDLDIELDSSIYEYNECKTQLAMRLSRGENIDVMILDHIWLGEFYKMMMQFDPAKLPQYDDIIPAYKKILEKYAEPEKTLGYYSSTDVRLIYWNKAIMKKLGINDVKINTWEDVKKYATMIKEKENLLDPGVKPVGFMAGGSEHTNSRWYDLLWSAGGDILSPDNKKAVFNSEAGVKALEFYGWFLKNGMVSPSDVLSPADGAVYDESFLKGKFVISLGNGYWIGQSTLANIGMSKETFLRDFDAALIPAPADGGTRGTSVAGGYMYGVSKFSKHPDLAVEFISYLCGAEGWNDPKTGKAGVPTVQSALYTIDPVPFSGLVKEALTCARFRPTIKEYGQISEIIRNAIQEYVLNYNKESAKDVLDRAAEKVDKLLK